VLIKFYENTFLSDGGFSLQIFSDVKVLSNVIFVKYDQFLGVFAKLLKRLLGASCLSFRLPSVRMEQLGPHWTDFYEI
jgi:hypothetical protein